MPTNGRRKSYSRRRRGTANRYAKKKRNYKRKFMARRKTAVNSYGAPFPQELFKVLKYSSPRQYTQQATVDVPSSAIQIRGNSLYDPDPAIGGTQPRYFDTLCGDISTSAPYYRYTVYAAKCTLHIWQDPSLGTNTGSVAGKVALYPFNGIPGSSSQLGVLQDFAERENCRVVDVGNANSSRPLKLSYFCKTSTIWRGSKVGYESDFTSAWNNNPVNQWSFNVQCCNVIPAGVNSGLFSFYWTYTMKYYVKFSTLNSVPSN